MRWDLNSNKQVPDNERSMLLTIITTMTIWPIKPTIQSKCMTMRLLLHSLTGAAYHNYGGNRQELNDVYGKRPDKELIFTETSIGMWNDGRNLNKRLMEDMEEVALVLLIIGVRQ